VFRGTVQRVAAANLDLVQADASTVVVRVDEVLKAPSSVGDFTGREITVKLLKGGAAIAGEQAVFFTNGWLYGAELIVAGKVVETHPAAVAGDSVSEHNPEWWEAVVQGRQYVAEDRQGRPFLPESPSPSKFRGSIYTTADPPLFYAHCPNRRPPGLVRPRNEDQREAIPVFQAAPARRGHGG
jgi:hypothetical protein